MRAVQLTAYGNPVEGLEFVDIPEPDAPGRTRSSSASNFLPSTRTTSCSPWASMRCARASHRHRQ